jgi:hypothetical protein
MINIETRSSIANPLCALMELHEMIHGAKVGIRVFDLERADELCLHVISGFREHPRCDEWMDQ